MKAESVIPTKSFNFALKIIRANQLLVRSKKEYILSKQLLRSGTSIGANISESGGAFSRKDFEFKLSLAYKEARETAYWLKLLMASDLLDIHLVNELIDDVEELQRLIGSSLITIRTLK